MFIITPPGFYPPVWQKDDGTIWIVGPARAGQTGRNAERRLTHADIAAIPIEHWEVAARLTSLLGGPAENYSGPLPDIVFDDRSLTGTLMN